MYYLIFILTINSMSYIQKIGYGIHPRTAATYRFISERDYKFLKLVL